MMVKFSFWFEPGVCASMNAVRQGFNSLEDATDDEEDLLDKAWGLSSTSRLSCQALVADADLTVEIPKYTINHAKEEH